MLVDLHDFGANIIVAIAALAGVALFCVILVFVIFR